MTIIQEEDFLSMIAKRRRLINFLEKVDKDRSSNIAKRVGLKD
jgi:small subunit ribosomal protein S15